MDMDRIRDAAETVHQLRFLFSKIESLFYLVREAHRNSPEQQALYHKKLLRALRSGYNTSSIATNPDVVAAAEHARHYWK